MKKFLLIINIGLLFWLTFIFSQNQLKAQTVGLFLNTEQAATGFTLFSPLGTNATYLVDNCGKLVHQWAHDTAPGLSVYLLENGQLLRTGRVGTNIFTPGGSGGKIQLIEWDGTVTWDYQYSSTTYHQHHDVEYLPNGNILILAWRVYSNNFAIENGRNPNQVNQTVWMTQIVEVEPQGTNGGNIVWQWNLADHLIQDFDVTKDNYGTVEDNPQLVNINYAAWPNPNNTPEPPEDWIHANSVDYNAELDQIIISARSFDEVWIIDHSTSTQEAAGHTGGNSGKGGDLLYRWGNPQAYNKGNANDRKLFGQHDAYWIPEGYADEGKIMIYNNGTNRPNGNYSSVDVIDLPINANNLYDLNANGTYGPENLDWTYEDLGNFYSRNISGAQRLPNSNTLICEGANGRFFEVDYDHNIVWEYINPISNNGPIQQGIPAEQNNVFRAYRYPLNYPAFNGINLQSSEPLELNPFNYECETETSLVTINTHITIQLSNQTLKINNQTGKSYTANLFNLMGQLVNSNSGINNLQFNVANHASGIYILQLIDEANSIIEIEKLYIK